MDEWTALHFSQAHRDVPTLLRLIADTLVEQDVEVMDIVFRPEGIEKDDWPSMTVYYSRPEHFANPS